MIDDPLGLYAAAGFSEDEVREQLEWNATHADEEGNVNYPPAEDSRPRMLSAEEVKAWHEGVAWLKGRRQEQDRAFLDRVESAKVPLNWLVDYRIGWPRKGHMVVPWCPPRRSGERLLMRLQDRWRVVSRVKGAWAKWRARNEHVDDNDN